MKSFSLRAVLGLSAAMFSLVATAANLNFTSSYKGGTTSCGTKYNIKGMEPISTGKKPVFIFMAGTNETYDNATAMAAVKGMADRGYVAATVEYASALFGRCSALQTKAKCVFDKSSAQSAVAAICSRLTADCSKGIVVGGFSQGALLAIMGKNFDGRVQAAYGMGAHKSYAGLFDTSTCVGDGTRTLPSTRLRIVNGEGDFYGGGTQTSVRDSSQVVTGYKCSGNNCLQPEGNGWRMVLDSEVADGSADHCYTRASGCLGSQNELDAGWATGGNDWQLKANLDWLTKFTAK